MRTWLVAVVSAGMMGSMQTLPAPTGLRFLATEGPHEFFQAQLSRPEHMQSWSLRSQASIDSVTGASENTYFRYVWPKDDYSDPQDAAKFVKHPNEAGGSDSIPGNMQLRHRMGVDSGKILITWDWYAGKEFRDNIGTINNYKHFQIRDGQGEANGAIWFEVRSRFSLAPTLEDVATIDTRMYAHTSYDFPAGFVRAAPYEPTGTNVAPASYPLKWGKWTRYWAEIEMNVPGSEFTEWRNEQLGGGPLPGTWHRLSLWVADEDRDPVRILYRVPWVIRTTHLAHFDFEFNTSSAAGSQTGPLIGYGRNVVVLRNLDANEADTTLFRRPVR